MMDNYKKLAEEGRAACVRSIDLLNNIIKGKKFLGQDTTEEKAQMALMMKRFDKINTVILKMEALLN